jgi:serine/threonine protein phosphatase PrpC
MTATQSSALPEAFETGAVSHVGRVRSHNEDAYVARPEFGVWAVADGMGGHENAAIDAIGPAASAADLLGRLEAAVLRANSELRALIRGRRGVAMGSTLVALLVFERHFACVWSGDSRIYLLRDGRMSQVSRDHTEVQDMIDSGVMTPEEAKHSPRRHVITRAIGVADTPELDLDSGELAEGDVFLLCSDGLTGHVTDAEIEVALRDTGAQAACEALLSLVLERGASDNVTIVVVRRQNGGGDDGGTTRWLPNARAARRSGS